MSASASKMGVYTKVDVETASQGKLVVMLFNGAIKRAEEAKRQLQKGSCEGVHNNLIRAQDIVGELRSALDMNMGEMADNLDRIYEYFQHLLITANIKKAQEPIETCVDMMTTMRDTWKEAFDNVARENAGKQVPAPQIRPHGDSVMNLQG